MEIEDFFNLNYPDVWNNFQSFILKSFREHGLILTFNSKNCTYVPLANSIVLTLKNDFSSSPIWNVYDFNRDMSPYEIRTTMPIIYFFNKENYDLRIINNSFKMYQNSFYIDKYMINNKEIDVYLKFNNSEDCLSMRNKLREEQNIYVNMKMTSKSVLDNRILFLKKNYYNFNKDFVNKYIIIAKEYMSEDLKSEEEKLKDALKKINLSVTNFNSMGIKNRDKKNDPKIIFPIMNQFFYNLQIRYPFDKKYLASGIDKRKSIIDSLLIDDFIDLTQEDLLSMINKEFKSLVKIYEKLQKNLQENINLYQKDCL